MNQLGIVQRYHYHRISCKPFSFLKALAGAQLAAEATSQESQGSRGGRKVAALEEVVATAADKATG